MLPGITFVLIIVLKLRSTLRVVFGARYFLTVFDCFCTKHKAHFHALARWIILVLLQQHGLSDDHRRVLHRKST